MSKLRKIVKKIGVAVGTMTMCLTLMNACTSPTPKEFPHHAAVIVSNTKNEGEMNTTFLSGDMLKLTAVGGSTVSYFNCDGNPKYMDTLEIPEYTAGISNTKKKQLAEGYTEDILGTLTEVTPKVEELDLFKAITLAARQLQDYEGKKTLYISSSGISTAGLVDFTKLYLENDHSEELVDALQQELPNLTGVKVVWVGMGETTGEQMDLYESNRRVLENTWKKILIASGVKEDDITVSGALSGDAKNDRSNLPHVTAVPVVSTMKDFENKAQTQTEWEEGTIVDLSDIVDFKPDSTELLTDHKEVVHSLDSMLTYLKSNKNNQILLVGTTSSWGEEDSLRTFSLQRCETIKNVLIGEGVQESQIQCIGAGFANNLTIPDRDENGALLEEKAQQNRKVYLYTNLHNSAAQKVLQQFQ